MSNNTPPSTSTALVLSPADRINRLDQLAVDHASASALVAHDAKFSGALGLAVAMKEIRDLMTPEIMAPIMELMNSPLGFKTDRPNKENPKPYTAAEIRDVAVEVILRGFRFVGNEFNVLAGNFYAAKEGLRRKVLEIPVLDLECDSSLPILKPGGAEVTSWATYRLSAEGPSQRFERTRFIRGNAISTADTYIGKAERKLLSDLLKKLTGNTHPDGDASDRMPAANARVVPTEPAQQQQRRPEKPAEAKTVLHTEEAVRKDCLEALGDWLKTYSLEEKAFLAEAAGQGHTGLEGRATFGDCSTEQLVKLGKRAEAICKGTKKSATAAA